jgi:hypothetical protein
MKNNSLQILLKNLPNLTQYCDRFFFLIFNSNRITRHYFKNVSLTPPNLDSSSFKESTLQSETKQRKLVQQENYTSWFVSFGILTSFFSFYNIFIPSLQNKKVY